MNNTDIITLDKKELIFAKDEAGKFVITGSAEAYIEKLLAAQQLVEDLIEQAKLVIGVEMTKENLIKIQGGRLSILKRFYGERYEVLDRDFALGQGLANEEIKIKVDSKAVEEWIKKHEGQIPEGIKLRDRVKKVSISMKKGEENGEQPEKTLPA